MWWWIDDAGLIQVNTQSSFALAHVEVKTSFIPDFYWIYGIGGASYLGARIW
jgi:hypothetical protein